MTYYKVQISISFRAQAKEALDQFTAATSTSASPSQNGPVRSRPSLALHISQYLMLSVHPRQPPGCSWQPPMDAHWQSPQGAGLDRTGSRRPPIKLLLLQTYWILPGNDDWSFIWSVQFRTSSVIKLRAISPLIEPYLNHKILSADFNSLYSVK